MAVGLTGWAGCGWDEPTGCAYWVGKLHRGEDAQIALARAAEAACVEARPLMLARLDDPSLGGDALAALIALGRSSEAETAVRRSLGDPARVAAAAAQVEEWKLAEAAPELVTALAEPKLASHRAKVLQAALAVVEPSALADALVALARAESEAATVRETAVEALGRVDWAKAAGSASKSAAALADLAVDPALGDAVLVALSRLPAGAAVTSTRLSEAATQGDRRALLLLTALGAAAGRDAAVAALTAGPKAGWESAAPLALGAEPGAFTESLSADEQDSDRLWQVLLLVGSAARERVAAMAADGKGDTRAAAIRGQVLLLSGPELAPWREAAQKHASALVREVVARPDVQAVAALSEACGAEAACLAKEITEAAPTLAGLDAELAAARQARDAARKVAEAAVAADRERAQALASLPAGAEADAGKAELEKLGARRDQAYKAVEAAAAEVDSGEARLTRLTVALARLTAAKAAEAVPAALRVLEHARGDSSATLRLWAYAALAGRAAPGDAAAIAEAADGLTADPGLAFALRRLSAAVAENP
ncbi:MAG: hypothetical protein R3F39_19515 [Myxococcota bacterium]